MLSFEIIEPIQTASSQTSLTGRSACLQYLCRLGDAVVATLLSPVEGGTQLLESLGLHPNQLLPQACPAPLRHPPLWGTLGGVVLEDHVGPSLSPSPFSALGGRVLGGPTGAREAPQEMRTPALSGAGAAVPSNDPRAEENLGWGEGQQEAPTLPPIQLGAGPGGPGLASAPREAPAPSGLSFTTCSNRGSLITPRALERQTLSASSPARMPGRLCTPL